MKMQKQVHFILNTWKKEQVEEREKERKRERMKDRKKERKKYEVGEDSNIRRKRNKERQIEA